MVKTNFLILIGGSSGTGKSSLTKNIQDYYKAKGVDVTVILRRNYYNDNSQNPSFVEFENPNSLDDERLVKDLKILLEGSDTYIPKIKREKWNDGVKLTRTDNAELKKANPIIIYDGCTALQFEVVRDLADLKIYLHTDGDIRLIRKIKRSKYYEELTGGVEKRSVTELQANSSLAEGLPEQFKGWIKNREDHKKFIEPTGQYADYVFNNGEEGDLEKITEVVIQLIEQKINLKRLIANIQDKIGDNLKPTLSLFLQIQKQIELGNINHQTQGQLILCQAFLQEKLSSEELQDLLSKQRTLLKLEERVNCLQKEKEQQYEVKQELPLK